MSQTRPGGAALVIFPGALGDFVCFLPTLEVLRERHPGGITVLCARALCRLALLAGAAEVRAIEGPEASWLFATSPPAEAEDFFARFDAIECFTGSGIPEVERNLARRSGGRVHRFRPVERVHFAVHCLRAIGVAAETARPVPLAIEGESAREVDASNRPARLVVHPGSGGIAKRWSAAGFRTVLDVWRREIGDVRVLLGPAEENEAGDWSLAGAPPTVPKDVLELARCLHLADVYLGNDSGASHLATAVGRRGLVLFGPASDEVRWAPLGDGLRVLRPEPWSPSDAAAPPAAIRRVVLALEEVLARRSP